MKCGGFGVYERFIWLNRPFMITSNTKPLQFPLLVEYHNDKNEEIVIQTVNRYEPISIREEGLYFVRLIMAENSDTTLKQDHVEIFKIDSIGIIGDFNNWEFSLPLHSTSVPLIYEVEMKLPSGRYEFKFRANDNWSVELSGKDHDLMSWLGDNLVMESDGSSSIKVTLDLSNHPWHVSIDHKG